MEKEQNVEEVVAELEKEVGEAMKELGDVASSSVKAYTLLKGKIKSTDDIVDVLADVLLKRSRFKLPWYMPKILVKQGLKTVLHGLVKEKTV